MDFSRAASRLMSSSGRATSMSFFLAGVIRLPSEGYGLQVVFGHLAKPPAYKREKTWPMPVGISGEMTLNKRRKAYLRVNTTSPQAHYSLFQLPVQRQAGGCQSRAIQI